MSDKIGADRATKHQDSPHVFQEIRLLLMFLLQFLELLTVNVFELISGFRLKEIKCIVVIQATVLIYVLIKSVCVVEPFETGSNLHALKVAAF